MVDCIFLNFLFIFSLKYVKLGFFFVSGPECWWFCVYSNQWSAKVGEDVAWLAGEATLWEPITARQTTAPRSTSWRIHRRTSCSWSQRKVCFFKWCT